MKNNISDAKNEFSLLSSDFLNLIPVICSLMVVMIHSYGIGDLSKTSVSALIISFLSHGVCTVAVPMFFFISGYMFYRNVRTIKDVVAKQIKRIKTVLVPFLAWSSFYFLFYLIGSHVFSFNTNVDTDFFGILKGIIFYKYTFPMWYMFQLCVYIALAPLLFYILKSKLVSAILLVISFITGMFIISSMDVNLGEFSRSIFQFEFFSYYFLGCILARTEEWSKCIKNFVQKIPFWILVFLFLILSFFESLFFDEIINSFNKRIFVPVAFITFLGLVIRVCNNRKFSKLPVPTMFIYGVHSFVGIVLGRIVFSHLDLPVLLHFVLGFVSTTIVSILLGKILKIIPPIYKIFTGNR